MRFVAQTRASAILFHLASSRPEKDGVYLVPANACPVVPLAITTAGRKVEFLDINATHLAMCPEKIRARLCDPGRPPVAGIVFIRPYGAIQQAAIDFRQLKRLSGNTLMIDDRCSAIPELDPGSLSDSGADVYLYSTGYGKYVDLREGGYAFLDPSVDYQNHWRPQASFVAQHYRQLECRWKSHFSGQLAGEFWDRETRSLGWLDSRPLALSQAEYMDAINERIEPIRRQKLLADQIYQSHIPGEAFIGDQFNDWRHQLVVAGKMQLLELLFANELFASGHYDTTARLFSNYDYPQSDHLYSRVINLFNDFNLTEAQMISVARLVKRHLEQRR